jgi:hypothetical protein
MKGTWTKLEFSDDEEEVPTKITKKDLTNKKPKAVKQAKKPKKGKSIKEAKKVESIHDSDSESESSSSDDSEMSITSVKNESYSSLLKEFDTLSAITEWIPDKTSENWIKCKTDDGLEYCCYDNPPAIQIHITQKLINDMKRMNELKEKLDKVNGYTGDKKIIKVYKIYDDERDEISYTSYTMIETLRTTLMSFLNNPAKQKLSEFKDITKVTYEMLGCYKSCNDEILDKKTILKIKQMKIDTQLKKTPMLKYQDALNKNVKDLIFELKPYYVYRIFDKTDAKKQFVFGTFTKQTIKKTIRDNYVLSCLNEKNTQLDLIDTKNVKTLSEGGICADKKIMEFDSLNNGLNMYYNVFNPNLDIKKVNDYIFQNTQKDVMNSTYIDTLDYKKIKGYVCKLTVDNKVYIFANDNNTTVTDELNILYDQMISNTLCDDKQRIGNEMKLVKFDTIGIQIIDVINDDVSIKKKLQYYIAMFKKSCNVVNGSDHEEVKKKVKRAFYAKK